MGWRPGPLGHGGENCAKLNLIATSCGAAHRRHKRHRILRAYQDIQRNRQVSLRMVPWVRFIILILACLVVKSILGFITSKLRAMTSQESLVDVPIIYTGSATGVASVSKKYCILFRTLSNPCDQGCQQSTNPIWSICTPKMLLNWCRWSVRANLPMFIFILL